jgi:hypothetical protein
MRQERIVEQKSKHTMSGSTHEYRRHEEVRQADRAGRCSNQLMLTESERGRQPRRADEVGLCGKKEDEAEKKSRKKKAL